MRFNCIFDCRNRVFRPFFSMRHWNTKPFGAQYHYVFIFGSAGKTLEGEGSLIINTESRHDMREYFKEVVVTQSACQKQVLRAGTSNYIPQYMWDVMTCVCPWYLLLAHTSPIAMGVSNTSQELDELLSLCCVCCGLVSLDFIDPH